MYLRDYGTFDHLINRYGIGATLLSVLHTFVLASSSWTCEEDLSEVPYFVLSGCQFGYAILCGLVPAVVLRSFGDRVEFLKVSVPLSPSLGRIHPWQV